MTAKITVARRHIDRLAFEVWLDITKFELDGTTPAERYMLRRDYPRAYELGRLAVALAAIKAELIAAGADQLARIADEDSGGVALSVEGQTFG